MTKNVVVTGSRGFIGSNLVHSLRHNSDIRVLEVHKESSEEEIHSALENCDVVVHLAGVNRPETEQDFQRQNVDFTAFLLSKLEKLGPKNFIFASSRQADSDTPYGESKRNAERLIAAYAATTGCRTRILRLPNVFGKWCKPNYNSVVSTFIFNIARGLDITVTDEDRILDLLYIDDLVENLVEEIRGGMERFRTPTWPIYRISVSDLASTLQEIHSAREEGRVLDVGTGLLRALYATYLSQLPRESFSYQLFPNTDARGTFIEFVKTPTSGQFSYFISKPKVTRGAHFHHTKAEKFVVMSGQACFRFRNLLDGEIYETKIDATRPTVVESIPGWAHEITNTGSADLIVGVWSSEVFSHSHSDTLPEAVDCEKT
jgi:UDP-2-acetamido-2,6-beta-L-arabino-hexul-4-ose reductase